MLYTDRKIERYRFFTVFTMFYSIFKNYVECNILKDFKLLAYLLRFLDYLVLIVYRQFKELFYSESFLCMECFTECHCELKCYCWLQTQTSVFRFIRIF